MHEAARRSEGWFPVAACVAFRELVGTGPAVGRRRVDEYYPTWKARPVLRPP